MRRRETPVPDAFNTQFPTPLAHTLHHKPCSCRSCVCVFAAVSVSVLMRVRNPAAAGLGGRPRPDAPLRRLLLLLLHRAQGGLKVPAPWVRWTRSTNDRIFAAWSSKFTAIAWHVFTAGCNPSTSGNRRDDAHLLVGVLCSHLTSLTRTTGNVHQSARCGQ
jgi:hypothetical protein